MPALPSGTLTCLFTDIEGSTRLLQTLGAEYVTLIELHHRIIRESVQHTGGHVVDIMGDGFFAVFGRARDALMACVEAQHALVAQAWPRGVSVRVRMGLHTGEPTPVGDTYLGIDVHWAARIAAAAHGGQVLLSETTASLVMRDLPDGSTLHDLGTHRLKDLADPVRIFEVHAPGIPSDFPPLRSLERHPNNIPRPLTSFVGREQELADVENLLTIHRLVTLTGSGGAGKTRLAIEVARRVLERFPDGVWFVDLSALSDPQLVPHAVADALRVREQPGRRIEETLADHLRSSQTLLVLDNCEHLLEAVAEFVLMSLEHCAHLLVLATSQARIGVKGEVFWRVPSLSVPEPDSVLSPEQLEASECGRLFLDRARAVSSGFRATPENAKAIAQLCHALDGIPLAVELAAARVGTLAPEQIVRRLDDRFRLLARGPRGETPRHQTLRAALDWSYQLLAPPEQTTLQRLAVFAGGFTLEAAEGVCGEPGAESSDVLDHLTALVDKSLVFTAQGGVPRYHLLETVRQYALDRLEASGQAGTVRRLHCAYFASYAETGELHLRGVEQGIWLERLSLELDNFRGATDYAIKRGDTDLACRLAGALWRVWYIRGHVREGVNWIQAALALPPGDDRAGRAKLLNAAGVMATVQRKLEAATQYYEQSLEIRRALGDRQGLASSLSNLAIVHMRRGDYRAAEGMLMESLELRRSIGDEAGIVASLHNLGNTAYAQGDLITARGWYEEALDLARRHGDAHAAANILIDLGNVAAGEDRYGAARTLYLESLTQLRELGDRAYVAFVLEGLARVETGEGRAASAARLMGAAEALRETIGVPLPPPWDRDFRMAAEAVRVALGESSFAAEWAAGRAMSIGEAFSYVASPPEG
jgi:predicted ATPase/class 3 adenylate cyclase